MSEPFQSDAGNKAVYAEHVRQNASSAGFAALLLCLFGYFMLGIPSGQSRFVLGNLLVLYAMRIGGPLLGLAAVASYSGKPIVLMLDGIVTLLIGAGLTLGGGLMLTDGGGLNPILCVVFGLMFLGAGGRNVRDYLAMHAGRLRLYALTEVTDPSPAAPAMGQPQAGFAPYEQPEQQQGATPPGSLASQITERHRQDPGALPQPADIAEPELNEPEGSWQVEDDTPIPSPEPAPLSHSSPPPVESEDDAPDGFLASFMDPKDAPTDPKDD